MKTRSALGLAVVAALLASAPLASAGDWPAWRGPHRDGTSEEKGLVSTWSKTGENLVWKAELAKEDVTARATPVVFDGRACISARAGAGLLRQEIVACFDAGTGKKLWERRFPVYNTTVPFSRVGWASLAGDPETGYVFAQNVDGQLVALDRAGKTVWQRRLGEELGRGSGFGGRTLVPIVDEDRLIVGLVGAGWGDMAGPRQRYVAFDKRTGAVRWVSTPSDGPFEDANNNASPTVGVVDGRRLMVAGGADGWLYAVDARTGEPVWKFHLSVRSVNSPPLFKGHVVYAAHSEENVDQPGLMGRVVAIDARGRGDITKTGEIWRSDGIAVGFAAPTIAEGRVHVVDNAANLHALDEKTGKPLWTFNLGTIGRGAPTFADGKLFATEQTGHVFILQGTATGARALDEEALTMPEGRFAEVWGSFAIAYGRLYLVAEDGLYCIGRKGAPFAAKASPPEPPAAPAPAGAPVARLLVVPAEVVAKAGEPLAFEAWAFDDKGRFLRKEKAQWSLEGLAGEITPDGVLKTPGSGDHRRQDQGHGRRPDGLGPGAPLRAPALDLRLRGRDGPAPLDRRRPALQGDGSRRGQAAAQAAGHERPLALDRVRRAGDDEGIHRRGRPPRHPPGAEAAGHGPHQPGLHPRLDGPPPEAAAADVGRRAREVVERAVRDRARHLVPREAARGRGGREGHGPRQGVEEGRAGARGLDDLPRGPDRGPGGRARDLRRLGDGHLLRRLHGEGERMTRKPLALALLLALVGGGAALLTGAPAAVERAMFGNTFSRNMVSDEKGLPADWDVKTGRNVKWWADVGSQAYAGPSVAGGKVFVGTNNDGLRNPALPNDRGVVMAFSAATGDFLWQMTHEKLDLRPRQRLAAAGDLLDPVRRGQPPLLHLQPGDPRLPRHRGVEGRQRRARDRREGEGADRRGRGVGVRHDGGARRLPAQPRGQLPARRGRRSSTPPPATASTRATSTSPSPQSPSFVALDAATGKLLWESNLPGEKILHGTWSNPAYGVIKGRPQVLFPGGNGWLYSLEPKTGKLLWKFNANPPGAKYVLGGRGTAQRDHREPRHLRGQGLRRRGPGPRARRGCRQLLVHRRHASTAT